MGSFLFQHGRFHAVPLAGINYNSVGIGVGFGHIFDFLAVLGDYLDNRKAELLGKFEVAVVMGGYAHDRAGTVVRQYVVGQPDGCLGPV